MIIWIVPVIAYILAIVSFIFGAYDTLWNFLEVRVNIRPSMTIGFSMLLLLIGHFMGVLLGDRNFNNKIDRIENRLNCITNDIYKMTVNRVGDGEDGLRYLVSKFPKITSFKNTRIPAPSSTEYQCSFSTTYSNEFKKLVNKGVVVRELVGGSFEHYCKDLQKLSQSNYEYKKIEPSPPSFINFSIMNFSGGQKEVLFGWPVSAIEEFSVSCFSSHEPALIEIFETVFREYYK